MENPDQQPYKLMGSERQRRYARQLRAQAVAPGVWRVWGGREPHMVTIAFGNGIANNCYQCDCEQARSGQVCSHAIALAAIFEPYRVAITLKDEKPEWYTGEE